jgi:hypothetical protein
MLPSGWAERAEYTEGACSGTMLPRNTLNWTGTEVLAQDGSVPLERAYRDYRTLLVPKWARTATNRE